MPSKKKPIDAPFGDDDAARALKMLIRLWPHVVGKHLVAVARCAAAEERVRTARRKAPVSIAQAVE
jgi:hypothetical protein